jgi:hypothetical protein
VSVTPLSAGCCVLGSEWPQNEPATTKRDELGSLGLSTHYLDYLVWTSRHDPLTGPRLQSNRDPQGRAKPLSALLDRWYWLGSGWAQPETSPRDRRARQLQHMMDSALARFETRPMEGGRRVDGPSPPPMRTLSPPASDRYKYSYCDWQNRLASSCLPLVKPTRLFSSTSFQDGPGSMQL